MKNKLPEQSCFVDQPGLHKHQLSSLHSPCPLHIFSFEHLYSKKKLDANYSNLRNFWKCWMQLESSRLGKYFIYAYLSNLLGGVCDQILDCIHNSCLHIHHYCCSQSYHCMLPHEVLLASWKQWNISDWATVVCNEMLH